MNSAGGSPLPNPSPTSGEGLKGFAMEPFPHSPAWQRGLGAERNKCIRTPSSKYSYRKIRGVATTLLAMCLLVGMLTSCVQPVTTPTATLVNSSVQAISLEAPPAGATVSAPLVLRGATAALPIDGKLTYRIFDSQGSLVGSGTMPVVGPAGSIGRFDASVNYTAPLAGPGRVEVLEINPADGSIRAVASVNVILMASLPTTPGATPASTAIVTPGGPTPIPSTPIPGVQQVITIETPPIGTIVGSPVTITGRVAQNPANGQLSFRVRDATGTQLGGGNFSVQPNGAFVASLIFNEPPNGGAISVEIGEPGKATAAISLNVAPQQKITFDSPPAGTFVGSPMTVTGQTARYPFQGALSYRVYAANNQQLGSGLVQVQGEPGRPGNFTAQVFFALPPGGDVRVELSDEDAVTGVVAARQSLQVRVVGLPTPIAVSPTSIIGPTPVVTAITATSLPSGVITIDSPVPGTAVGSPMTITGRVSVTPATSQLRVQIRDANGRLLGSTQIQITGSVGQLGQFNSPVTFTLPDRDGTIVLEVQDLDNNGVVRSSALVLVQVTRPTPYPAP